MTSLKEDAGYERAVGNSYNKSQIELYKMMPTLRFLGHEL